MPTDIALGIVTFLLAVLGGVVSAHAPTRIGFKVAYITAFVALGVAGAFNIVKQSRETASAEQKAKVAQINLSNSIESLGKAAQESKRVAELNTELQQRLLTSNATIASLATHAVNATTGGNSFCYIIPVRNWPGQFMAAHHGEYPVYGIQGRVVDLIAFEEATSKGSMPGGLPADNLMVGDLAPHSSKLVAFPLSLPSSDEGYFRIFFTSTRNGFWVEDLDTRKVKGVWVSAIRVTRQPPDSKPFDAMKPIVPKDFPRPVHWR